MGSAHGGTLSARYLPGSTAVHRLEPHAKLVSVLTFAVVVVATPVHAPCAPGAYAGYLLAVLAVAAVAGVGPGRLVRGLVVEVPFVLFAVLLPFVAGGPQVEVLGMSVSQTGLAAGTGLLAKATLSILAATVLAATTEPRALLRGLERLRLPQVLVQILMFMIRYADVVGGELHRMRIARESRGFTGGGLRDPGGRRHRRRPVRPVLRAGERVHLAMLSRGYHGRMPAGPSAPVGTRSWAVALSLPLTAATVLLAGMLLG